MIKQLLNSVIAKYRDLSMSRKYLSCSPLTTLNALLAFQMNPDPNIRLRTVVVLNLTTALV